MHSDCVDGDIRLVNGPTQLEGRVEVCINQAWGSVCQYSWRDSDASVVCNQLGYQRGGKNIKFTVVVLYACEHRFYHSP